MTSTTTASGPRSTERHRGLWASMDVRNGNAMGYLFLVPSLLIVLVFIVYPVVQSFYWSFTDYTGFNQAQWVGLENYAYVLRSKEPLSWISHNITFAVLYTTVVTFAGLVLALILNQDLRARNTFRTIYFLPYVIPAIISALVWNFLLTPQFDPIEAIFGAVGLGELWKPWLADARTAFYVAIFITVWGNTGFSMVLYLAALQNIPRDLYDAASVDGASGFQRITRITVPLLRPITLVLIILAVIGSMKIFGVIWGLTHGIKRPPMEVMATAIIRVGFSFNKVGRACALAVVLFLIIFVLTLIQLQVMRSSEAIEY